MLVFAALVGSIATACSGSDANAPHGSTNAAGGADDAVAGASGATETVGGARGDGGVSGLAGRRSGEAGADEPAAGAGGGVAVTCDAESFHDDASANCVPKRSCAPGFSCEYAGDAFNDRQCVECPAGTFTSEPNQPTCAVWSTCALGTSVGKAPTASNDRECVTCATGTTSLTTNAAACAPSVKKVQVSDTHTCALLTDGTVKCFGYNAFGWLGYGNTKFIGSASVLPSAVGFVNVTNEAGVYVSDIGVGRSHTCALLSNGSVKCWGSNLFGELGSADSRTIGDDELPSSIGPVSVTTTPGVKVAQLAVGDDHACVLLSDDSVKCWGRNNMGQLGYGNTKNIGDDELPSSIGAVSVTTMPGVKVTQLSAGGDHTCTLLSDGTAKCWGANKSGELGYANLANIGDKAPPSSVGPISITTSASLQPSRLVIGESHACAILSNGSLKCWGANSSGQLGYGNKNTIGDDELPSSVGVVSVAPDLATVTQVALGVVNTCALLSDGSVRCWGEGLYYQLVDTSPPGQSIGDDELPSSVEPRITSTPGDSVVALALGGRTSCAQWSEGWIKCWGQNDSGQLGIGTNQPCCAVPPAQLAPIQLF